MKSDTIGLQVNMQWVTKSREFWFKMVASQARTWFCAEKCC